MNNFLQNKAKQSIVIIGFTILLFSFGVISNAEESSDIITPKVLIERTEKIIKSDDCLFSKKDISNITKWTKNKSYKKLAKFYQEQGEITTSAFKKGSYWQQAADYYYLNRNLEEANTLYLDLIRSYKLYIDLEVAISQLLKFADHYTKGEMLTFGFSDAKTAIEILWSLTINIPGHKLAAQINLKLVKLYMAESDFQSAIVQQYTILKKYPGTPEAVEAKFLMGKSYYLMALKYDQDGGNSTQAMVLLKDFLVAVPDSQFTEEAKSMIKFCQDKSAKVLLQKAKFYWFSKYSYQRKPLHARKTLYKLILSFPNSSSVAEAKELIKTIEDAGVINEETALKWNKKEAAKPRGIKRLFAPLFSKKEAPEKTESQEKEDKQTSNCTTKHPYLTIGYFDTCQLLFPYEEELKSGEKDTTPNDVTDKVYDIDGRDINMDLHARKPKKDNNKDDAKCKKCDSDKCNKKECK